MDGAQVLVDPKLGRVLVAKRSFAIGELVLREPPLLVWQRHGDESGNYLAAFAMAPNEVKTAVLEMYHPPLDTVTPVIADRRRQAEAYATAIEADLILKLFLIRDTNAHSYRGQQEAYEELMVPLSQQAPSSALFDVGSKAAHSCLPNVEYSSKNSFGLEYRAIRPIAEGEYIFYSYIDQLWTSSQEDRRARLLQTKAFVCNCSRCAAPDDCRAAACPECKALLAFPDSRLEGPPLIGSTVVLKGLQSRPSLNGESGVVERWVEERERYGVRVNSELLSLKVESLGSPDTWRCACGHATCGFKESETLVRGGLDRLEALMQGGQLHQISPHSLKQIVRRVTTTLSATHYLVACAYEVSNKALASHAVTVGRAAASIQDAEDKAEALRSQVCR